MTGKSIALCAMLLLAAGQLQANGRQAECRAAEPSSRTHGILHTIHVGVVFPFRFAAWAVYYIIRAPGRLAEQIAFGETGEDLAKVYDDRSLGAPHL